MDNTRIDPNGTHEFTCSDKRFTVWFKNSEPYLIAVTNRQADVWNFRGANACAMLAEKFPVLNSHLNHEIKANMGMG